MNIQLPGLTEPELLKACRCYEKYSYISDHIFTQKSLRLPQDRQIRLSGWEISSEKKSRRSSVFKVVGREEVTYDLAIGKGWFEEDENADEELSPDIQTDMLESGLYLTCCLICSSVNVLQSRLRSVRPSCPLRSHRSTRRNSQPISYFIITITLRLFGLNRC